MAENSTKLMTDGKQQIQNAQRTLGLQNAEGKKRKDLPLGRLYSNCRRLEKKGLKGEILKEAREEKDLVCRRRKKRMTSHFLSETCKQKKEYEISRGFKE